MSKLLKPTSQVLQFIAMVRGIHEAGLVAATLTTDGVEFHVEPQGVGLWAFTVTDGDESRLMNAVQFATNFEFEPNTDGPMEPGGTSTWGPGGPL